MIRFLCLAAMLLLPAACAVQRGLLPPYALEVTAEPVPLDPSDPARTQLGRLRWMGGVELRSPLPAFGGLSSLEWHRGRLHAITDEGGFTSFVPVERDGRLTGVFDVEWGYTVDADQNPLDGPGERDSEALAHDGEAWLAAFEQRHRIMRYRQLDEPPEPSGVDPVALLGPLEDNNGVEAIAARDGRIFLCAERLATEAAPHCLIRSTRGTEAVRLPTPAGLDPRTAYPVDADWAADGTLWVLMRSWSGGPDNRAAILTRSPLGEVRTVATFVTPVTRDNYEGIALREEGGQTFVYVVSDNNFGRFDDPARPEARQRTLLLKFALVG